MFLDDFLYMHLHIIGSSVRGVRGSMHLLVSRGLVNNGNSEEQPSLDIMTADVEELFT